MTTLGKGANMLKKLLGKILPVPEPGNWGKHYECTTRTCDAWYPSHRIRESYTVCPDCGADSPNSNCPPVQPVIRRKIYNTRYDWHWERRLDVE